MSEIRVGKHLVIKIPDELKLAAEGNPSGEEAKVIRELEQQAKNLSDIKFEVTGLVCSSATFYEDKVEAEALKQIIEMRLDDVKNGRVKTMSEFRSELSRLKEIAIKCEDDILEASDEDLSDFKE